MVVSTLFWGKDQVAVYMVDVDAWLNRDQNRTFFISPMSEFAQRGSMDP